MYISLEKHMLPVINNVVSRLALFLSSYKFSIYEIAGSRFENFRGKRYLPNTYVFESA